MSHQANDEDRFLREHRSHDPGHLLARWRRVAKTSRLEVEKLGEDAGLPVHFLRPRRRRGEAGSGLYLCAGVHGDEPGSVLGLLTWAEENLDLLARTDVLILPLFNPFGLVQNTRRDSRGRDLNRSFHLRRVPLFAAWHRLLEGRRFRLALCLHEDYDARGCYLYELTRQREFLGQRMLEAAEPHVPTDPRRTIEGRRLADAGVIRRRRPPDMRGEEPEAITLFENHCDLSITFETPSEFSLYRRVRAQVAAIGAATSQLGGL